MRGISLLTGCALLAMLTTVSEAKGKIDPAFNWLKGTVWNWNDWRHVTFGDDGIFRAPSPECSGDNEGECTWEASKDMITVDWGEAGEHYLQVVKKNKELFGQKHDGEECKAKFYKRLIPTSPGPINLLVNSFITMAGGKSSAVGKVISETYEEFAPMIDYSPEEVFENTKTGAVELYTWYKGLYDAATSKEMNKQYKYYQKEAKSAYKTAVTEHENQGCVITAVVLSCIAVSEISLMVTGFVGSKVLGNINGDSIGQPMMVGGTILVFGMLGRIVMGI